tara:strand:- start:1591 stop:1713 length:123 start_codon:yes stop_codon:yes gene_type:complete
MQFENIGWGSRAFASDTVCVDIPLARILTLAVGIDEALAT